MSQSEGYSVEQLEAIADAVWGDGLFSPGGSPFRVPCPECGANIRVYVDGTTGSQMYPRRFRAICSSCSIDSSGRSTTAARRRFTDEEIENLTEAYSLGQRPHCLQCESAPLNFQELGISGSNRDIYQIRCYRCGSG